MKKWIAFTSIATLFAAGMLFVGVALAQQSGQDTLNVTISDTALVVSPSTPNSTANTPFTLIVQNTGTFTYSLVLEQPGAINQPLQTPARPARIDNIAPNQSQTQTWTIANAGTYQLAAYTSTNATTASVLSTILVVGSGTTSPDVTGTVAATGTSVATSVATVAATVAATDTPAATSTTAATATSAATAVAAATDTPAATSALAATGIATGTAEAALPQTGGPDDSLPMSILMIAFGALFVVGGLLVGRRLARSR